MDKEEFVTVCYIIFDIEAAIAWGFIICQEVKWREEGAWEDQKATRKRIAIKDEQRTGWIRTIAWRRRA